MKEKKKIVVTGISILCASGNNRDEFIKKAREGICSIRKTDLFPTEKLRTDYFGQINKPFIYEVKDFEQKSRLECMFDDLQNQLLLDSGLTVDEIKCRREKVGFSFATSIGVNDYITAHVNGTIENSLAKSNIHKLPSSFGIKGPVFVNTSACAAGTTALGTAYSLIKSGAVDMVIAGGIDPLTEFSGYGFHSLQNLSSQPCRPFDQNRDGITLGEGGSLFVIEELSSALKRGAHIYAEVLGYGLGNDAYHATSPDPTGNGAYRVMRQALDQAGISADEIGYINAHGTGTLINDSMEIKAIERLGCECSVTSTKSQIGHCLAAAGAIEFAAVILSIENGEVYPNVNLNDAIKTSSKINLVKGKTKIEKLNYALSNSFAFAGNAASIVIGGNVDAE